jgi:hypothetical protein
MDARLQRLLDLREREAAARDANREIARFRDDMSERAPEARSFSYEVVLREDATFEQVARDVLPRLVYHLECMGAPLPECAGVFLSVFEGPRLHFILAAQFVGLCAEMLGTTTALLARKHGPSLQPLVLRAPARETLN